MQTVLRICFNLFRVLDGWVVLITHQIVADVLSIRTCTKLPTLTATDYTCIWLKKEQLSGSRKNLKQPLRMICTMTWSIHCCLKRSTQSLTVIHHVGYVACLFLLLADVCQTLILKTANLINFRYLNCSSQ